jgi:cell division septation protein DedD
VGPFASRREADMAREKLKALGMEPGLLLTVRK